MAEPRRRPPKMSLQRSSACQCGPTAKRQSRVGGSGTQKKADPRGESIYVNQNQKIKRPGGVGASGRRLCHPRATTGPRTATYQTQIPRFRDHTCNCTHKKKVVAHAPHCPLSACHTPPFFFAAQGRSGGKNYSTKDDDIKDDRGTSVWSS